jgi:hypothetical protein
MIIECLYVYLLDFICASTAILYSCFFLFGCYFISASCTASGKHMCDLFHSFTLG